jgi:tRNA(fMet)-specific endonuclease VapC
VSEEPSERRAIAVVNELPVYTCNPADFRGIDGLEIVAVAVPEPDADEA